MIEESLTYCPECYQKIKEKKKKKKNKDNPETNKNKESQSIKALNLSYI